MALYPHGLYSYGPIASQPLWLWLWPYTVTAFIVMAIHRRGLYSYGPTRVGPGMTVPAARLAFAVTASYNYGRIW